MTVHEQVMKSMLEMAANFAKSGVTLEMPPHSNLTLNTKYVEIEYGKRLAAEIAFDSRFTNPMRLFQGGFLCAAIDEVFGPLTYMAAERPVVTIEMSTTFVRPFTAADQSITIQAEVISKTKTLMVLKAEVRTKEGKLVAIANNHSLIVSDANLRK